ncbi:MAG TPA: carboxypeptidase regulatory-like domain-containing protein [Planctomycetota bacterium]|nr:carboxypeptidase regulatory-like domain-containing protein [Planctomycetota bacterium]
MKRSTLAVLALALLLLLAFFLHRGLRERTPQQRQSPTSRAELVDAAPAAPRESSPVSIAARSAVVPPAPSAAGVGTIRGVVRLKGPIPQRKTYRAAADPECEKMHGARIVSDEFVVDPQGNIQWAFVYVKSGLSGSVPPAPATPVYLDQVSCVYTPHVVGVRVGQPLVVLNSDELLHNVHGLPYVNKEFNVGLYKGHTEMTRAFDKPEVMFKIKCDVHPWMSAWIGVLDHPYFSITNAVGSYGIPNLPPGRYEVEAWHEKCARSTFLIEVPVGGDATLDFWLDVKQD